jgi:signal recognition particle receptor subunit beta
MTVRSTPRSGKGARSVKVVVTGPFGAGKTTMIKTISEITVLSTERKVTDSTASLKRQTTVAMDFGRLTIDRDLVLYLFGSPGQKRFDFMWEILAEGMLGFIVLVDAQREESHDEAAEILDFFRHSASVPYVVAVNKTDDDAETSVRRARSWLRLDDDVRVVACNALDKESVKEVLLELLYAVLDDIEASQPAAV